MIRLRWEEVDLDNTRQRSFEAGFIRMSSCLIRSQAVNHSRCFSKEEH